MSTLTANLQFSVSSSNSSSGNNAFDLVEESEDQDYLRQAVYQPFLGWQRLQEQGNGKYGEALPLARLGVINLRVYCPASVVPELVPLDPIDQEEKLAFYAGGFSFLYLGGSGYNGKQVESRGRARSTKTELIKFDGSNSEALEYTYDMGEVSVLYQTQFLDADGNEADAPVFNNLGEFVADKEVYGALTVRYQPSYHRFKVFYDLTGFGFDVEVRGWFTALKGRRQPALPILARHGTQSDLKEFSRDVEDWDFSQFNTGNDDFDGAEDPTKTVSEERRITNPDDPDDYVDVETPVRMEFRDSNGRIIVLRRVSP